MNFDLDLSQPTSQTKRFPLQASHQVGQLQWSTGPFWKITERFVMENKENVFWVSLCSADGGVFSEHVGPFIGLVFVLLGVTPHAQNERNHLKPA